LLALMQVMGAWSWTGVTPQQSLPLRGALKSTCKNGKRNNSPFGLKQISLLYPFLQVLFRQRQMRRHASPGPSPLLSRSSVRKTTTCFSKACQVHKRMCRSFGRPDSDAADMDDTEPEKEAQMFEPAGRVFALPGSVLAMAGTPKGQRLLGAAKAPARPLPAHQRMKTLSAQALSE
jgi:hypothetical protein